MDLRKTREQLGTIGDRLLTLNTTLDDVYVFIEKVHQPDRFGITIEMKDEAKRLMGILERT